MEVHLTDDQMALIRPGIENGRYRREKDAVRDALAMWEERERRRAEILAAVDNAEASIAHGDGRRVSAPEEAAQLAGEIKLRGRSRLAALQSKS